jgi:hypothetical protein
VSRGGHRAIPSWKRSVVLAVLAVVALWPLAHRALVALWGIHPWKLSSWAMYASPVPPSLTLVLVPEGRHWTPLDEAALPASARSVLRDFRRDRTALGWLRPPSDVAEAVFEADPDLEALVVAIQRFELDHESARITSVKDQYTYVREEFERTHTATDMQVLRADE